jgi:hypothetical protein
MGNKKKRILLKLLLHIVRWLIAQIYGIQVITGETKIMANYVVKDDNPDIQYNIQVTGLVDSEGREIPVKVAIDSSDEDVIQLVKVDEKSGTVHFGGPGLAAIGYQALSEDGKVLASGGDLFTVTTGDPAGVVSIEATFEGLTPVAPNPPPVESAVTSIPAGSVPESAPVSAPESVPTSV